MQMLSFLIKYESSRLNVGDRGHSWRSYHAHRVTCRYPVRAPRPRMYEDQLWLLDSSFTLFAHYQRAKIFHVSGDDLADPVVSRPHIQIVLYRKVI